MLAFDWPRGLVGWLGAALVCVAAATGGCGSGEASGDDSGEGKGGSTNACSPGQTQACVGPGACRGGQRCLDDGSAWGLCDCGTATGGSTGTGGIGGTTGSGGITGLGGASPTGGTASGGSATGGVAATGGTIPTAGTTATGGTAGTSGSTSQINLTVVYGGTLPRTLSHCYGCSAYYFPASDTGRVAYQVEDGYTQFNLQFDPNPSGGYYLVATLLEQNMGIAAMYFGLYYEPAYFTTNYRVPVAQSCVTFSALELRAGGRVAGSINNCMFRGGNGTTEITAAINGTFSATFPP